MTHLTIIAKDPQDLVAAQQRLTEHLTGRIDNLAHHLVELEENLDIAKRNKWRTSGLKSAISRQKKILRYYETIQTAVEAGYHIVPEMHARVFAIRTDRRPRQSIGTSQLRAGEAQAARQLPAGEGEYKEPRPYVVLDEITRDDKGKVTKYWRPADEFEDVDFPVVGVRPEVMEATSRAMALKVFDEIGILPQHRCGDPLIVGRINGPNYRSCCFVIAWWLDMEAL